MVDIKDIILRGDRFYVRVPSEKSNEIMKVIPRAVYVWLKGNPSFKSIPKGYVIHHLDYDPTNDDLSNLALMCKPHHSAHHLKRQIINTQVITVGDPDIPHPKYYPKIYFDSSKMRWFIRIREAVGISNKTKVKSYFKYMGKHISSRVEAETVAKEIWERYGDSDIQLTLTVEDRKRPDETLKKEGVHG